MKIINTDNMKHLSILAAFALLTASCANDGNTPDTDSGNQVAVNLSAGIGQKDRAAQTRALNNQWTAGDAIGLCMFATGTTQTAEAVFNFRYNAANGGESTGFAPATAAQTAYYPTTGDRVDLLAYYPYTATLSADGKLPVDVSSQQNLAAIDLMSATAAADKDHPNINLVFSHRLTRLTFALSRKGSVGMDELAGATLTIGGMNTKAVYNLHGNSLAAPSAQQDITVPLNAAGTQGTAIVLPRAAAPGVSYVITLTDGSRFTAYLSDAQELKAGTSNLFRITLSPEPVSVSATITDWEGAPDTDLTAAQIDVVTTADATTDFAPGAQFTLWAGEATGNGILFTLNDDRQWSNATPLYWDSYPDATTTFYALHTPDATPQGNRAPDVLAATATTARFAPIELAFAHLMTQLSVVLKAGTGMTQAEVETAAVTLPQALADYTLEGITLTPGNTRKDITLAGDKDKRRALLVPQTIAAGKSLLVLTIGTQTYTLKATDKNGVFEGGKSYTLTVTVNRTAASMSVSIGQWQEGGESEGDAGMEIE